MWQRLEKRASARDAEAAAQERANIERRELEQQSESGDSHAAAAKRHRTSGFKDVVKEQRDTRTYAIGVNEDRIRELAERGASVSSLAGAFVITEADVLSVSAD